MSAAQSAPAVTTAPGCKARASIPWLQDDQLLRDDVVERLGISHFELGRLLRDKIAPLPVRFDGVIFWYADEVADAAPEVKRVVERWRRWRTRPAASEVSQ